MGFSVFQSYLGDVLHAISQALLAPDIILLIAFIVYALFCIGSVITEAVTERKNFKVSMPRFEADLMGASDSQIPEVVERSGLLNRQKMALLTVYDYRVLPGDALIALIKRLMAEEESNYDKIVGRNNTAAKIAPMLGLMGTLIPLGPGIGALSSGNITQLGSSLIIAFDTTVAGLAAAAVCLVIAKIRRNWYEDYMTALDSSMATMLQKIETMRESGQIKTEEPSDYSGIFAESLKKDKREKAEQGGRAGRAEDDAHDSDNHGPAPIPSNNLSPSDLDARQFEEGAD